MIEITEDIKQKYNVSQVADYDGTIKLVLPSEESSFTSKDGKVTKGGFRIGNPTIYVCGFQTQETPYVIKNGKTIFFKDVVTK